MNRDIEALQQLTKDLRVIGGVLNLSLEVTVDALKFPNVKKSIENYKEKRDEFKDRKLFPDKAYNWITKEAKNAVKMIPDPDFQEAQQILLELRVMW